MNFSPYQFKISYHDGTSEIIPINNEKSCGNKVRLCLKSDEKGIVTTTLTALEDVMPGYLNVEFKIPESALTDDLYYYYATFTTNDIASVFQHKQKPKNDMKDLILMKNIATGEGFNVGLLTAQRFFAIIRLENNTVSVHFDLENKLIEKGTTLTLERFIYGNEQENEFLEKRYAPLTAELNSARPLSSVPTGWCSWSCYYRNVDDKKITDRVEDISNIEGADLFQIDDGWQIDGTFPGDWHVDPEKFPQGLEGIIKRCNDNGITFGLWLSPFLVAEDSVYYESVKHLVRTDVVAGNSTPTKIYHPFDLDNPEYYDLLYKTYHWLSHEMNVKYYKLDFLIFGYFSFKCQISFKTDYKSALFRKVVQTIRDAVGDDAIMLSCGSPITECAGIFDAQRISRDIICPKSSGDPFYWQHWSNIKNASKTVLYRYFYNNVVFRNDPDGVVLRDYDIGDGFDCNYAEARYWSTIVAFSGGLVLTNDELRDLSRPRKELFTKLIPALGISGRANDMFEYPAPTKAIIEASDKTRFIASFNMSDKFENMDVNLKDFGIDGKKLIFKCWESEFVSLADSVHERLVNPHNALMYMVKDVPEEPTFIYSDVNVYLGENVFSSEFENGKLTVNVKDGYTQFVNDTTKVYAYYPKAYTSAISDEEIISCKTDDFVIVEYKIKR